MNSAEGDKATCMRQEWGVGTRPPVKRKTVQIEIKCIDSHAGNI